MKSAIVTLATGEYTIGASVLFYSFLSNTSLTNIDCICLTDMESDCDQLRSLGVKLYNIGRLSKALEGVSLSNRFAKTLHKLDILELGSYGYERVVFLDSDTLIRKSIDYLFSDALFSRPIWAVRDYACHFYHAQSLRSIGLKPRFIFNTGLLVINPMHSLLRREDLIRFIKTGVRSYDGGDQGYFNIYVQQCMGVEELGVIDLRYNYAMDPFYPKLKGNEVVINHFTGVKPWNANPSDLDFDQDAYLAWYYNYYAMKARVTYADVFRRQS